MTATARARDTEAVLEAERRRRRVRHAQGSLIDWVQLTSAPGYDAGWVHRDVCARLERFSAQVAAQESPRLILAMPPRHGKTHIVSQRWPVWHMAQHAHEVVCASYGADLAEHNSRAAREVARGEAAREVFPLIIPEPPVKRGYADYRRSDVDRIDLWRVGGGASYKAVGVGGALTGHGAHVAIIDDPFKDRAEADSPARRNAVWAWYASTLYTRLAPGGGIVVMATRWHDDDLTGRLLQAMEDGSGDEWEIVSYPAIAEEDELHRRAGEALHPARFDLKRLLPIKAAIGSREWEALYQQRPVPATGGRIKREWFGVRYACAPTDIARTADEVWVTVDAAKKGNDDSDYHAIHVWARKDNTKYLLDRKAERVGYPGFERLLDDTIGRWATAIVRTGGGALIEDTANGTTYLQVRGSSYMGVALIPFHPNKDTPGTDKSKGARATYLERAAESGGIILPEASIAPWVDEVLTWWCAFPRGKHDDDVDAASQLLMRWALDESVVDLNGYLSFVARW